MPEERNIFADDKKLMHLCEDFLHHREEMKDRAITEPDKSPTTARLIEVLRYDDDPTPLSLEEFQELQFFVDGSYADWKGAIIEQSTSEYLGSDGRPKDIIFE